MHHQPPFPSGPTQPGPASWPHGKPQVGSSLLRRIAANNFMDAYLLRRRGVYFPRRPPGGRGCPGRLKMNGGGLPFPRVNTRVNVPGGGAEGTATSESTGSWNATALTDGRDRSRHDAALTDAGVPSPRPGRTRPCTLYSAPSRPILLPLWTGAGVVREQVGAATPERCRHALLVVHLRWQLELAGTAADVGAHGVIDAPRKDRDPGVTAEARRGCDRGQYACALTFGWRMCLVRTGVPSDAEVCGRSWVGWTAGGSWVAFEVLCIWST